MQININKLKKEKKLPLIACGLIAILQSCTSPASISDFRGYYEYAEDSEESYIKMTEINGVMFRELRESQIEMQVSTKEDQ